MPATIPLEEFKRLHGDWTSMSIHLGNGLHTLPPAPDGRLTRIVQAVSDFAGKPFHQLRVLDLACAEGHYAIECAMQGAEVVGIEFREESLARARFAKDYLRLDRLTFYQDDVRNLTREKYGTFDVVICSGILYHLDVPDVFHFVQRVYDVCTRLVFLDTEVVPRPVETVEFEGFRYHGDWFIEHAERSDANTRQSNLWGSIDNARSFWFTHASLTNLMGRVGFTSFLESLVPHHDLFQGRRAYVAIKGATCSVLTSPATASMGVRWRPEVAPLHPSQARRNIAVRLVKRVLPKRALAVLKVVAWRIRSPKFRDEIRPVVLAARATAKPANRDLP
jgi:ubiquinone/menaquinone biosynthesis C-methylase UbiE